MRIEGWVVIQLLIQLGEETWPQIYCPRGLMATQRHSGEVLKQFQKGYRGIKNYDRWGGLENQKARYKTQCVRFTEPESTPPEVCLTYEKTCPGEPTLVKW